MTWTVKKKLVLGVIAAAFVALCLALVFPTDDQLLMTPSTHDKNRYLSIDDSKLAGSNVLRFAAYDADCGVVQLCFAVGKNVNQFDYVSDDLTLYINGEAVESFSQAAHTTWKRKYVMILIDEVDLDAQICLTYGGKTITIQ